MPVANCAVYLLAIGLFIRCVGIAYPRRWFRYDRFPYKGLPWELGGKFYRKFGIQYWKEKVPDASRKNKKMFRKKTGLQPDSERLERLVQETCVAEFAHYQLILLSIPVFWICPGWGGWVIYGLCVSINMIFVLIQRYNRPRLLHALQRARDKTPV